MMVCMLYKHAGCHVLEMMDWLYVDTTLFVPITKRLHGLRMVGFLLTIFFAVSRYDLWCYTINNTTGFMTRYCAPSLIASPLLAFRQFGVCKMVVFVVKKYCRLYLVHFVLSSGLFAIT